MHILGQRPELRLEALKAQVDTERLLILAKECASSIDSGWINGIGDLDQGWPSSASRPSFLVPAVHAEERGLRASAGRRSCEPPQQREEETDHARRHDLGLA